MEILSRFGLNRLEAEVYIDLLQNPPATGYAIGKRLGRPTANVYKAIEALAQRGALMIEEGTRSRFCRAVPPAEFLMQLERAFATQKASALAALESVAVEPPADERIYALDSPTLVFERARTMLARCKSIAVLDAFPKAMLAIRPALVAAEKRGVRIIVQAYQPVELSNMEVTLTHLSEENLALWQSQQLNLVIDGEECLLALLNHDLSVVHQAVSSKSVYISFLLHVGLLRENNAHQLLQSAETTPTTKEILALDERFHPAHVVGLNTLLRRYGVNRNQ